MIAYLIGTVSEIYEDRIVLDVGGIGYDLSISSRSLDLYKIGTKQKVYTYLQVSENGISFYGFSSLEEKKMFLQLITVSGIGPKGAMAVLSGLDLATLATSIATGDSKTLSKIKGIGKKTAERIILELKESVSPLTSSEYIDLPQKGQNKDVLDAILALRSLGISQQDAVRAVKEAEKSAKSIEELITLALKSL